jgi:hypothetical protein
MIKLKNIINEISFIDQVFDDEPTKKETPYAVINLVQNIARRLVPEVGDKWINYVGVEENPNGVWMIKNLCNDITLLYRSEGDAWLIIMPDSPSPKPLNKNNLKIIIKHWI